MVTSADHNHESTRTYPNDASPGGRHITDLDQSYDDYGNEIFVEEWEPINLRRLVGLKGCSDGFDREIETHWIIG